MKTKDKRPRFGWCAGLDDEPQEVWETRRYAGPKGISVVLIPLPFMSPKMKKTVREFAKGLWPKEDGR